MKPSPPARKLETVCAPSRAARRTLARATPVFWGDLLVVFYEGEPWLTAHGHTWRIRLRAGLLGELRAAHDRVRVFGDTSPGEPPPPILTP